MSSKVNVAIMVGTFVLTAAAVILGFWSHDGAAAIPAGIVAGLIMTFLVWRLTHAVRRLVAMFARPKSG